MQTRSRLAEIFKDRSDYERYYAMLNEIIEADKEAGPDRTDRSRYLASQAALVLAEQQIYEAFREARSRATVRREPRREAVAHGYRARRTFEDLVTYEVADVTAAATYYIAEIYFEFSTSLLESERPEGLTEAEKVNDYELVIEEEAFPFEERSINVHEAEHRAARERRLQRLGADRVSTALPC